MRQSAPKIKGRIIAPSINDCLPGFEKMKVARLQEQLLLKYCKAEVLRTKRSNLCRQKNIRKKYLNYNIHCFTK
ncbi:MAG: hypothetical protein K0R92_3009 [Lachnospiraceae bacterium]|jgi:hypothetical protein|nr:hypothetical protein [Lachnospiraceae bacterium]